MVTCWVPKTQGIYCSSFSRLERYEVDPEQILITSGAQQAFVLISYVLMNKNDTVWYENPGHIAGRDVMRIVGGDVSPVPIDGEGLTALCNSKFFYTQADLYNTISSATTGDHHVPPEKAGSSKICS